MATEVPAYGARAAKAPLAPLTIERHKPGPLDIEIEILYSGISRSDVHKVNDDWAGTHFSVVPGHEIVGRVASRGASATRYREGDSASEESIPKKSRCLLCPQLVPLVKVELIRAVTSKLTIIHQASCLEPKFQR